MADQDLRVDQSAEDEPTGSGPTGSGGGAPGGGTPDSPDDKDMVPSDGPGDAGSADGDQPPSGADVDPLGDPKDGPLTFEDDGGVEGPVGAGGGGGSSSSGGGLFGDLADAVSDAYDDVEDSVNDAADDAGDAAGGAYGKVEDGAASLGHDIEHEVAEEWRDAGTWDHGVADGDLPEHQGGLLWDPVGTVSAPFEAADRASDPVEDAVSDAYEDSGVKDAAEDAYDGWKTLDDAPGDAITDGVWHTNHALWGNQTGEDVYENVEKSVADAYDDTEEAVADAPGAVLDTGYGTGAAADAALDDLGFGSGGDDGTGVDGFGRGNGESGPADPLAHVDDVPWNDTQEVAEQAGEEGAQDATSQVEGLLDEPGPIDTPEPESLELG